MQYANAETPEIEIGGETYKVELVYADNGSSTDKAPSAASSLVSAGVSIVLGSYGSVLLAMVYCLISMMILPCHSAVDKMDFTLVEAARDLGSAPWRAFVDVTLPLTLPGILAGCVLVFVPSVGIFYLSDIMGGGMVLVGNLIRDQLLKVRDWNTGSAMSMVLIFITAGIYLVYRRSGGDDLGVF